MNFNTLLVEFSERNDIEFSPEKGDDGSVWADFDDGKTQLKLVPHSRDEIRIESDVATVDPESDDGRRTLVALLKGNLALLKHQTGSLALSTDRRSVVLFERVKLPEMNTLEFSEVVEAFLDRLDIFRRGLSASI